MERNDAANVNEAIATINAAIAKLNVSGRGSKYPMMAAPATQLEFATFVIDAVNKSRELPSIYTAAAEQSKAYTDCVWVRTGRASGDYVRMPLSVMDWLVYHHDARSRDGIVRQKYFALAPIAEEVLKAEAVENNPNPDEQ